MATLLANRKMPNTNGWQDRHNEATRRPLGFEHGLVPMLQGWADYALQHRRRYESPIGPAWEEIGDSLRTLLNGDLGRLDGGTLDHYILETMRENGVDTENK